QFKTTPNTPSVTVQLRAAEVSLLTARLTVIDQNGQVIESVAAPDPLHADVSIHINPAAANSTYYVKVEGATDTAFGLRAYQLAISSGPSLPASSSPNPPTRGGNFQSGDGNVDTATNLQPKYYREDRRFAI